MGNISQQIWKPDTTVKNLLEFRQVKMLEMVQALSLFQDDDLGYKVHYMATATSTVTCEMYFSDFPFDQQICRYDVTSSAYDEDELIFNSTVTSELGRAFFQSFDVGIEAEHDGADNRGHSLVGFKVKLSRRPAMYIFKYYLPSFGIVMVSWISFLIPPDAIPGRTGLLVTLFLVLTTLFGGIQASNSISFLMQ